MPTSRLKRPQHERVTTYTLRRSDGMSSRHMKRKPLILGISVLALLLLVGAIVWYFVLLSHQTPQPDTSTTHTTSDTSKNNEQPTGSTETKGGSGDTTTSTSGTMPDAPSGQFVSNHEPNNTDALEGSICATTPGAYCTISFTRGAVTKSLPKKQADSNGNATWDSWTPSSIGLTPGTWHIVAVASNGDKTARAADSTDLVVGQ